MNDFNYMRLAAELVMGRRLDQKSRAKSGMCLMMNLSKWSSKRSSVYWKKLNIEKFQRRIFRIYF